MPSIVTHHYFAKDVLNQLPIEIKKSIQNQENLYYIFAQSFDNLFYYKFLTPWQGKNIRDLGEKAQQTNINLYFKNILLEKNNLNIDILRAYLYGSICHYCLDRTCHPFIFYYTGHKNIAYKYRGLHEKMEVNIDAYIYKEKTKNDIKNASLGDVLLPKTTLPFELKKSMNQIFQNTFQEQKIGEYYEKSIKTGNFLLKHFVTDQKGFKKSIYKIKDSITFWSKRKYQYLSFHVTNINLSFLNLQHEKWCYPTNKNITHYESFPELYNKALNDTLNIIKEIEKYLHNQYSLTYTLKIIDNISYTTGTDANQKIEMKYFKF